MANHTRRDAKQNISKQRRSWYVRIGVVSFALLLSLMALVLVFTLNDATGVRQKSLKFKAILSEMIDDSSDSLVSLLPNSAKVEKGPLHLSQFDFNNGNPERVSIETTENASPVLVIIPHPDDEAFSMSGTLATLAANDVPLRVYLVSDGEGAKACAKWVKKHRGAKYDYNKDGKVDAYDCAAARREEFKKSAAAMGIPKKSLVFLGNAYHNSPIDKLQPTTIAIFINEDCARNDFVLDEKTRVMTVAPLLGYDERAMFFGEVFHKQKMESNLHRVCAYTATRFSDIDPTNVYFFKVYAHDDRIEGPAGPIQVDLSQSAQKARRNSIRAYHAIGKDSVRDLYRGALLETQECATTLTQLKEAGYDFP